MAKLVIVESPAKAKTIGKYLGKDYEVTASMGHIRDLPASQLGIDIEHDYAPQYISIKGKEKLIKELKSKAKHSDGVLLATDPDREGEAISWHLANILGLDPHEPNRVTFDEITKKGVKEGMAHPRAINEDLFNAQQARRVLDRLVGYKLSPFLWRKVRRGLSAGRVQSVAVRIIDDREKEIEAFKPEEYWNAPYEQAYRGLSSDGSSYIGFAGCAARDIKDNPLKCGPYGDTMIYLGRHGAESFEMPAASAEYLPMPYFHDPDDRLEYGNDYPLVLTEGRIPYFHHGTLRNTPYTRELYPYPETWINPETAREIGIENGDWLWLESRRGKTQGRARVTKSVAPKVIYQERFWNPELLVLGRPEPRVAGDEHQPVDPEQRRMPVQRRVRNLYPARHHHQDNQGRRRAGGACGPSPRTSPRGCPNRLRTPEEVPHNVALRYRRRSRPLHRLPRLRDRLQKRERSGAWLVLEQSGAGGPVRRLPASAPVLLAGYVPAVRRLAVHARVPHRRQLSR